MSVYVGIDVHRKRSQVAVLGEDGKVTVNRNFVNGSGPMTRLLESPAAGTPTAFEAAGGGGWPACWSGWARCRTWCSRCGARRITSALQRRRSPFDLMAAP